MSRIKFSGTFLEQFQKLNLPAWPTGHEGVAVVVLRRSAVRLNAFLSSVREHNYHKQSKLRLFKNIT